MQGLRAFGLSDNEIAVFEQLTKFGPQSVWAVAVNSGIKRTSAYDIIKGLMKKDLVQADRVAKKNVYRAADPAVLLEQLDLRRDALKDAVRELKKIAHVSVDTTKLIRYTGVSGIRTTMGMLLADSHTIYGYGSNKLSEQLLSFYPENFAQKRLDRKIRMHALVEPGEKFSAQNSLFQEYTHIKHHPLMSKQRIVYFLQNRKVIMLKLDGLDPQAIYIEDDVVYDSQKKFFDYLWNNAKR